VQVELINSIGRVKVNTKKETAEAESIKSRKNKEY
jgi:hypothetical protein